MKILVLGGYGGTGKVFCRMLLEKTDWNVIVAGRNKKKAEEYAEILKRKFPGERVEFRHADAADRSSLRSAFKECDLVLIAATTAEYARTIAEEAIEAGIDYIDIYFQQDVFATLKTIEEKILSSGRCFITQGGFHPGLPAIFIRSGALHFSNYKKALIAFVMNEKIENPYSLIELVDSFAEYKPEVYRNGKWVPGSYKDEIKIDFGKGWGKRSCVPIGMIEMKGMPEKFGLAETGVYVAGFNWFVDYLVFPLIMMSHKIKRGLFRKLWARIMSWGINYFSTGNEGVVFILLAEGQNGGRLKKVMIRAEHHSAYEFTVIPVIALIKQFDSMRKPGLYMMGHIADPEILINDMRKMGVRIEIFTDF